MGSARIDGFYTSPMLRAVQTAQIIGEKCGIKPKVDKRLMERRWGKLDGMAFDSQDDMNYAMVEEIKSGYKKGMEPWKDLQRRLRSFEESVRGTVIAVTHHDPILAALGIVDGRYDDYYSTPIAMASATTIDFEKKAILNIGGNAIPNI
jgi:probable phosphoglycerate mutase